MKTVDLFEETVPFESNISKQHIYKQNKYAHFETDITTHKALITAFEVGARGQLTSENKLRIKSLHSFMRKDLKFKTFVNNISALASNSSYYIFTCRKQPVWDLSDFLSPDF